jgi:hypothetical protein
MNHGWPNLGHDCLVQAVREAATEMGPALAETGLVVRAISYDVRRYRQIPEMPNGRFAIYLGTGGPGHIDPRYNDGVREGSQGICESPSWEKPLFRLFDAILENREAALLAVCHTFGVLCRWSGVAEPALRGPAKGKSTGIRENVLTPEARSHPWFQRLARRLPDGEHFSIIDSRLYDLIPTSRSFPGGVLPLGYESEGRRGPPGEALTMLEWAREPGEVLPRVFAVNHHPEVVDRERQLQVLDEKLRRGEVTREWYHERRLTLTQNHTDEECDRALALTSHYTLLAPLRFHLRRQVRRRAEALGRPIDVHEESIGSDAAG